MEVTQLTIDDVLSRGYDIAKLDKEAGIYPRIDWLTFMFTDHSISDVFDFLCLSEPIDESMGELYERSGLTDQVVFVYNYIRLEVCKSYFYGKNAEGKSMFDVVVPSIRLDLSATALDYLRSTGFEFYEKRCSDLKAYSFHVTRCDWAFDLVNYKPEFIDQLIEHLSNNQLASGRVPLISTSGAIKYRLRLGDEKVVYLGASKSDKLLRVYDKRLQCIDPISDTYVKPCPYGTPDSWIRIELQTRNYTAHGLLMPGEDGQIREFVDILKYIFDHYAFADASVDVHNYKRTPTDFWVNLFPWDEVKTKIIQNAKYVQPKSRSERVKDTFEALQIRNVLLYIHEFGWDQFFFVMSEYIRKLDPSLDLVNPQNPKRRMAFYSMLNELTKQVTSDKSSDSCLYNLCGRLYFKKPDGSLVSYYDV